MVLSAELSAEWRDSGEAEGISLIERGRESKRSARDKPSKRVIVAARNLPKEADGRFVALAGPPVQAAWPLVDQVGRAQTT